MDTETSHKIEAGAPLTATDRLKWWAIFPVRLFVEIAVVLIDTMLSRYIIAGAVVGVFWVPCHFLFDASFKAWMWPTIILGLGLIGLWEGCHMFEIRPYFANLVLTPPEPWQIRAKGQKCTPVAGATEIEQAQEHEGK